MPNLIALFRILDILVPNCDREHALALETPVSAVFGNSMVTRQFKEDVANISDQPGAPIQWFPSDHSLFLGHSFNRNFLITMGIQNAQRLRGGRPPFSPRWPWAGSNFNNDSCNYVAGRFSTPYLYIDAKDRFPQVLPLGPRRATLD